MVARLAAFLVACVVLVSLGLVVAVFVLPPGGPGTTCKNPSPTWVDPR